MDRFKLLEWLIGREQGSAPAISGIDLLTELGRIGIDWTQIANAAGELLELGWVKARRMQRPGAAGGPNPQMLTAHELQEFADFQVTEKGYAMHRDRNPEPQGPTFNISHSHIGQLAAGDINNITIENVLVAIEQEIENVEGTDEDKTQARQTVGRMRDLLTGAGSTAVAGVLSAAARAALGLP
jgi:hypothetical protein